MAISVLLWKITSPLSPSSRLHQNLHQHLLPSWSSLASKFIALTALTINLVLKHTFLTLLSRRWLCSRLLAMFSVPHFPQREDSVCLSSWASLAKRAPNTIKWLCVKNGISYSSSVFSCSLSPQCLYAFVYDFMASQDAPGSVVPLYPLFLFFSLLLSVLCVHLHIKPVTPCFLQSTLHPRAQSPSLANFPLLVYFYTLFQLSPYWGSLVLFVSASASITFWALAHWFHSIHVHWLHFYFSSLD